MDEKIEESCEGCGDPFETKDLEDGFCAACTEYLEEDIDDDVDDANEAVALDSVKDRGRKMLFLGPPGTGKTTAACMYKPEARKLVLDIDEKLAAQENIPPGIRSRIDVWSPGVPLSGPRIGITRVERYEEHGKNKVKIPGTEGFIPKNPMGFQKTVDYINHLLEMSDKGDFPYAVTVFDGITATAEHLDRLVKSHHQASSFSQPLWGIFGTNLLELVKGFLALPGDKIMIVHSKLVQDEATAEVHTRPLIAGFMADALPKEFNEVYYFLGECKSQVDGKPVEKYMVRTRANSKYVARTTKSFAAEEPIDKVLAELNK